MIRVEAQTLSADMPPLLEAAYDMFAKAGPDAQAHLACDLLSTEVQIMHDDGEPDPSYIYFGPGHMTLRFFGAEFAKNAVGNRGIPDEQLGSGVRDRYREVSWTKKPSWDRIRGGIDGLNGRAAIEYDRLILPTELRKRLPTFSVVLSLRRTLDVRG